MRERSNLACCDEDMRAKTEIFDFAHEGTDAHELSELEKDEKDLQELNNRAAGEVVIREALAELDIWEVEAKFSFTEHVATNGDRIPLIKEWKEVLFIIASKVTINSFNIFSGSGQGGG